MRAAVALVVLTVPVFVVGCGASHRAVAQHTVAPPLKVRYLALVSASTGKPVRDVSYLPANGAVSDRRGGWFVGLWPAATKSSWGGAPPLVRSGIVHLRPDGSLDRQWGTRQSRSIAVCQLVRAGSRLFTLSPRARYDHGWRWAVVQAFDASTGALLWTGPRVTPHDPGGGCGAVSAAATSKRVYLGGNFMVGGLLRSSAALDARTGRLVDWRIPSLREGPTQRGSVNALTLAGSRVYVAGSFSSVGGHRRFGLAALDARTGALLPWKPERPPDRISTIFVTRGDVLVSGRDGFAALDARTGRPSSVAWPSRITGIADAFAVDGPLLYIGGGLPAVVDSVDGQRRNNLASFNVASGRFTSWAPNLAPYVMVRVIVPSGDAVLVGGAFENTIG